MRFFVCFVLYIAIAQNLFCFVVFRFLSLAALSAYICSRGLKILVSIHLNFLYFLIVLLTC
ncbi:hypothetical protein C2R51_06200 [Helicobacter pylori]|nr:hypothetical protein C2R51_06200 [Helicobacter pylori]